MPEMSLPKSPSSGLRIVALFTDVLPFGGVQLAGRLTCRALAEIAPAHGWTLELLSLNDPPGLHEIPGCPHDVQVRGFGRNKFRFVLAALRQAWSARPGIVLAAHPHLALPAAWMQHLRPSLRVLVMAWGIEVWKPLTPARRKALHAARLVIVPSSDTANRLASVQGLDASKVRRLPLPLSSDFPDMAQQPQSLPLPPQFPRGRIVLAVGRWVANERYKGADELIRAIPNLLQSVPDVNLVAVGTGDDLPRLRAIAVELHIEDRVHFLENLTNQELAACYAHCDLFALPSTGEGYGLVFLEAMAFAKPVVGVSAGGVTDIVRNAENGFLVPPGNSESLVQALEKLLLDDSLRVRLGRAGAQIVSRNYSFDSFRARLEQILLECAAGAACS
jgi:phosphatidylinositol alpha-1,6-mannosyltransferase